MSKILLNETYKLPEIVLKRGYELRRSGYGPYRTAEIIRDEGLGEYNKLTLDKHLDHPDNIKKYTETGDYHPKNERTSQSVIKKRSNEIKPEDAFKMRRNGISDAAIAEKYRVDPQTLKIHLDDTHKDHPSYVPSVFKSRPKNPEDLNNSIIGMHGTINKETGDYHTYSTIAKAHSVTRSKVAGIISRYRGKENKMESIKDRIKNVLNESNLIKKRQEVIARVRQGLKDEGPERRDKHFSELHAILVNAHNELSALESRRDIHPDVAKRSRNVRKQLVDHVDQIMSNPDKK